MSKLLLFLFSLFSFSATPTPVPLAVTHSDRYTFSVYADNLGHPRDLQFDPQGRLLVSLTREGKIVRFESDQPKDLLTHLNKPHGLAYLGDTLYIAETNKVSLYQNGALQKLVDLPSDGMHFTRSLLPYKNNLLVSIGSDCNACTESDSPR